MEINVTRGELRKAVAAVKPVAMVGPASEVASVLIQASHDATGPYAMLTTDGGSVMASVTIRAEVIRAGSFQADVAALSKVIAGGKAVEPVTLAVDDVLALGEGEIKPRMWVTVGPVRHAIDAGTIGVMTVELADTGSCALWNLDDFGTALRRVSFAMAGPDAIRQNLYGVFLHERDGTVAMVATDGTRLALAGTDLSTGTSGLPDNGEGKDGIIVPGDAVAFLERVTKDGDAARVKVTHDGIHMATDSFELRCKRYDGSYPPVDRVFPDPDGVDRAKVTFDVGQFGKAVQAAKPSRDAIVTMNGYCTVGESTAIDGAPALDGGGVRFSAARLQGVAKMFPGEATMNYTPGGGEPVLFTSPAIPDYSILLMPVRST